MLLYYLVYVLNMPALLTVTGICVCVCLCLSGFKCVSISLCNHHPVHVYTAMSSLL